jgi:hypothetical protein
MTELERMYMAYVRWVKKQGYRTIFECPVSWTEWMVRRSQSAPAAPTGEGK